MDVQLEVLPDKPQRREIFNFKDKQAQSIFKENTSKTKEFSKCFMNSKPLNHQINDWRNVLNDYCKMSFKKIRINAKKKIKPQNPKIVSLINLRNKLVKERVECKQCEKKFQRISQMSSHMRMDHKVEKAFECNACGETFQHERSLETHMKLIHDEKVEINCQICGEELKEQIRINIHMNNHKIKNIENRIAKIEAEEKRLIVLKKFKRFSDNPENVNLQEIWKVLKSLGPKFKSSNPMAKRNHRSKIIFNSDQIRALLAKEYKQRLRARPKRSDLGDLEIRKNEIFDLQMKLAEANISKELNISDLKLALKGLTNNKSIDQRNF